MTITIDCRWIDSSGVGVYLRECLPFFLDSGNFLFLLGVSRRLAPELSERKNAEILECPVKPFSFRELLFFPRFLLKKINSGDIYYSPYFNIPGGLKVPVYTTIHDIIFPDMPELCSGTGLAARMWFYRRAFSRSKKIFTVSEFSKLRIEHYSKNRVPVIVTYNAIQKWILENRNRNVKKKNIILFIGNIKKHKGLYYLLDAFQQARKGGLSHRLIIIGSKEKFRTSDNTILRKIEELGNDAVSFTGFISDEMLMEYLSTAALLVQPSLYEGFCLPPLEALAAGTPVLISDIPVLQEIYKEYPQRQLGYEFPVYWFKAGDSKSLQEQLLLLLKGKEPEKIVLQDELETLYTFEKTFSVILRELKS